MLLERKNRKKENKEGSWAVSYVDMLTLLLCFFIIFYNNANQQQEEPSALQKIVFDLATTQQGAPSVKSDGTTQANAGTEGMEGDRVDVKGEGSGCAPGQGGAGCAGAAAGGNAGGQIAGAKGGGGFGFGQGSGDGTQFGVNLWGKRASAGKGNISVSPEDLALLELIKTRMGEQLSARIKMTEKSLEVNFEGLSFFESGQVKVRKEAEAAIVRIIDLLAKYKDTVRITVQGHTDPQRLKAKLAFADNWELSALRATSVLKLFIKHGYSQDRLSAEGFAETRVEKPIEQMTPKELAMLRRITLRIEPMAARAPASEKGGETQ